MSASRAFRRAFHRVPWLPLPTLQDPHQALRQRPHLRLALAARQMPLLQTPHFPHVPAHRARHRPPLRRLLSRLRPQPRHREMALLHLPDHRPHHHRSPRPHPARRHQFARPVLGLFFAVFIPPDDGFVFLVQLPRPPRRLPDMGLRLLDALFGAAFGSLLLWGAAALYKLFRGREGMGFGDVKMMAMVGAFLGLRGSFITILLGTLLGSILGLALIIALYAFGWKRALAERASRRGLGTVGNLRWAIASQYQLPLGTFLGIGALVVVFFFSIMMTTSPRASLIPC